VRRLVVFLAASAAVQGVLFSALAPLLPSFEREFGLSKAQAGLLVGMFAVGQGVAALPVGLFASRVSVKRFVLAGLIILAAASAAFGLADTFVELLMTRFLQGACAGLCLSSGYAWLVAAAPRARRGEMIGILSGAASAGQLLGPVIGGVAVLTGRAGAFAGVAAFTLLVAIIGARLPDPPMGSRQPLALVLAAHRSAAVIGGLCLVAVPGLLLGVVFALAPLQLDRLGWGAVGIAGAFLVAASAGVAARPLIGRWADRRGLLDALRRLLLICIPVTLVIPWVGSPWVLAGCIVCAVTTYGVLIGPSLAFASHAYEAAGLTQVLGFALMILISGIALFTGSAAGGWVAHIGGDAASYTLAAGICFSTFTVLALRSRVPVREEAIAATFPRKNAVGRPWRSRSGK
jgi:predicted MFS family arabinose efflux permease